MKVILYNIHLEKMFKISVKVSVTFTMQLMSNHTSKIQPKFPLKSMVISIFSKFGIIKLLKN